MEKILVRDEILGRPGREAKRWDVVRREALYIQYRKREMEAGSMCTSRIRPFKRIQSICMYIYYGNGLIREEEEVCAILPSSITHKPHWLRIETEIAVPRTTPTRIEPSASHPDSEPILLSLGNAMSLLLLLLAPLPLP